MKRITVIGGWLTFALGLPGALIFGGFTPVTTAVNIKVDLLTGNRELLFLQLASAVLWSIWLFGLCAFLIDIWRLKSHRLSGHTSFSARRWTMACAAAVWSLLVASRASATPGAQHAPVATIHEFGQDIPRSESDSVSRSAAPLALSASTLVVAGVLQLVQQRQESVKRKSAAHSHVQPLGLRSQSTLTEMQLALTITSGDRLRDAIVTAMNSEPSPLIASWRPQSALRALHCRTKIIGTAPLCCVPLGMSRGEMILITISTGELISVAQTLGDETSGILVHLANAIVIETIGSLTHVVACGFDETEVIYAPHLAVVNTTTDLIDRARVLALQHDVIVCSKQTLSTEILMNLREAGCGVVAPKVEVVSDITLQHSNAGWSISQTQQSISVFGISQHESAAISRLVQEVSRPTNVPMRVEPCALLGDWRVIVRVLGPLEVMSRDGLPITFEKSKSVELLAWLTSHRSRPTRSAARTALWEVNVQDATFTNVVSDARRSLSKVVSLDDGDEWLPRTLTDALPLHLAVITDGELLNASVQQALSLDQPRALVVLREALGYVRDLPFSGNNYLWPDAEGITTQLTLSVMTAAVMASELYLEHGDTEGVFWATGCGLKVLPGHEELLALRMRAHALKGDLAAVRAEWDSHQRAIAHDPWSGGVTSPKLDELCRELLRSRRAVHSVSE